MSVNENSSIYGDPPATEVQGARTPSPSNSAVSSLAWRNPTVLSWPTGRDELFATSNRVPRGDGEAATSQTLQWERWYPEGVRYSRDPNLAGLPNSRFLEYLDAFMTHVGYQAEPAGTAREAYQRFREFIHAVDRGGSRGMYTRDLAARGLYPIFERLRFDMSSFGPMHSGTRPVTPVSVPDTVRPAAGRPSFNITDQITASSTTWDQWNNPRREAERREDQRERDPPPHQANWRVSSTFPTSSGYMASPERPIVAASPQGMGAYSAFHRGYQGQAESGNTSYYSFRETPPTYDSRNVTFRRTSAAPPGIATRPDPTIGHTPYRVNGSAGRTRPANYARGPGSPTAPHGNSGGNDPSGSSDRSSSGSPANGPPGPPRGGGFPPGPPGGGGNPSGPPGGGPPGGNPPHGGPGNTGGAPHGSGAPPPPPPGGPPGGPGNGGPPGPPGGPPGGNGPPPANFGVGGPLPALPPGRTVDQEIQRESKKDIRKPKPFDGTDRGKWDSYVTDLNMHFFAKPFSYQLDHDRIILGAAWLKEDSIAQKHWTNLIRNQPNHPALTSWDAWMREFGGRFGLVNREVHAQKAIRGLRMKKDEHFPDFLVSFDGYAADTRWNDYALTDALLQAVPERLLDNLALRPRPRDYQELREVLDQLDFRYWESEQDKQRWKQTNPTTTAYSPNTRFANRRYGNSTTGNTSARDSRDNQSSGSREGSSSTTGTAVARAARQDPSSSGGSRNGQPEARQWVDDATFQERKSKGLCGICGGNDHTPRDPRHRGQQVYGRAVITLDADGEKLCDFFEYEEEDEPNGAEQPGEDPAPSTEDEGIDPGASDANP